MRPNLMSPRRIRTSGEDSILAMLERDPAHKRGSGASGARRAWYGLGAAMAMALTGALVWLVANNDGVGRDLPDTVLADAGRMLPPPVPAGVSELAQPDAGVAPAEAATAGAVLHQVALATPEPGASLPSPAVIVDQPPPADAVPPLRLLKPAPASAKAAPAPVRAPISAANAPARSAAKAASPARPAPASAKEARAPARPAAGVAKPRPVLVAKNAVKQVAQPRNQRSGTPAREAEGGVDADVALISAVIVHANGHAPEGSQMTELLCPNDSCKASPVRQ